jgi:hypothetical protein
MLPEVCSEVCSIVRAAGAAAAPLRTHAAVA